MLAVVASLACSPSLTHFPCHFAPPAAPVQTDPRQRLETLARSALFTVTAQSEEAEQRTGAKNWAVRVQPGFFVGADAKGNRIGVTRYSALHRAQKISASIDGVSKEQPLELLGAEPLSDVALVRLLPPNKPQKSPVEAAAVPDASTRAARIGLDSSDAKVDALWILCVTGQPQSFRVIPAASLIEDVDMALDESEAASPRSKTLRARTLKSDADAKGLGGCPVVDAAGRLVEIWNWAWPGSFNNTDTVDATVVRDLVRQFANEPGMTPTQRAQRYGSVRRKGLAIPALTWRDKTANPSQNACSIATSFADRVGCPRCNGSGEQPVETDSTDVARKGSTVGKVRKEVDPVRCKVCDGKRLETAKNIWLHSRALATALACVPHDDSGLERVKRELEVAVSRAFARNSELFRNQLDDAAKEEIRPANVVVGRAVAFTIPQEEWQRASTPPGSGQVREVTSQAFGRLLLLNPAERSTFAEGERALVVGAIAGHVSRGDQDIVVLDRCFVVPIKKDLETAGR